MTSSILSLILLLGINIAVGQNFWNRYQQRSMPYFNENDKWGALLAQTPGLYTFGTVGVPSQGPDKAYEERDRKIHGVDTYQQPYTHWNINPLLNPVAYHHLNHPPFNSFVNLPFNFKNSLLHTTRKVS